MAAPTHHQDLWHVPEPRSGLMRHWDTFIGPGATQAEVALILGSAVLGAVMVIALNRLNDLQWSVVQMILAIVLAADLFGGVATNATRAAKRWYHREGQSHIHHLGFIAIHGVQIAIVAFFFTEANWAWGVVVYVYLMAAALIITLTPLYLQRSLALMFIVGGLLMNQYLLIEIPGMEWFVPVLYLKLLVAHLLRETPYAPNS